jgi:uroporphyrin-III C-methyltransferase / precorrin-2 dehydrogenase / sirohydrochlorin ferrochelatase
VNQSTQAPRRKHLMDPSAPRKAPDPAELARLQRVQRIVTSSLVFTTGHDLKGAALPDWARLAIDGASVAVYMGRSTAAEVAQRLQDAGLSPDTAVAVAENASLGNRRLFHGTLADLPELQDRTDLTGPVLTIIGDAVAGANLDRSAPLAAHRARNAAARVAGGETKR